MGDFAVEGSELKKMVKLAKKEPVSFGFNPGKSEEDAYCGMHRNKPPAQIGKEAKDTGEGGKFTFGTAFVVGKEIRLTCLRDLPGLAKRFKKYLKSQKVMLNVVILDADGNVLESDIENDLPDDPELEGEDEQEGNEQQQEQEQDNGETVALDPNAILKRLGLLRDRIGTLPPEAQAKLGGPFKQLVDLAKANELDRASAGADKLEAAIEMLSGQTIPEAPPPPVDPQLQRLIQAAAVTRTKAEALPDDNTRASLLAALDRVDGHIKALEAEAAITILKKLGDILKSLAAKAPQGQENGKEQEGNEDQQQNGDDKNAEGGPKGEWESRFAALEPRINAALTQGLIEKVDDLRKLRDWATGMAAQNQHDKALQALPRIEALLETVREDGQTAFESEVAPEVKPFAMARLRWAGARSTMMSEVQKLASAIQAEAAEDDILEVAAANVSLLTQNVAKLDERLEDKLDSIVNAKTGPDRDRLKDEARKLINEYQGELGTPFFRDIDDSSGFASVAVASTARAALAEISRVLA